jgi:hypothetical protein
MARFFSCLLLVVFCQMLPSLPAGAGEAKPIRGEMPFMPGEQLVFALKWGFIAAGEATLSVLPMATVDQDEVYHFVMTAQTNSVVDLFYKVRDRIDSYADLSMSHSLVYRKDQQEGSTIRDIEVLFDWDARQVHYTDRGESRKPLPVQPYSFDPLSVFYYVRMLDLQEGGIHEYPVTDGKKNLLARLTVLGRETIKVPAGTFDTYKLAPDLRDLGGVFEKSRNAKLFLWVSADEGHRLVKIQSKVVVGSFVAELTSINEPGQTARIEASNELLDRGKVAQGG